MMKATVSNPVSAKLYEVSQWETCSRAQTTTPLSIHRAGLVPFREVFPPRISPRRTSRSRSSAASRLKRPVSSVFRTQSTGCGGASRQRIFGKISAKCCSFSAVSAPIFARKYAFCSIFQDLPDYVAENFEIWQNFAIFATFAKFLLNFHENC